jgi:hypothetical protein
MFGARWRQMGDGMSFDVMDWMRRQGKNGKGEPQFERIVGERIERVVGTMAHLGAEGAKGVSGEVTIKFSFELEGNEVKVYPKVSSKEPAEALNAGTSYIGPDNKLWDQDPKQFAFDFKGGGVSIRTEVKGAGGGNGPAKGTGSSGNDLKAPER